MELINQLTTVALKRKPLIFSLIMETHLFTKKITLINILIISSMLTMSCLQQTNNDKHIKNQDFKLKNMTSYASVFDGQWHLDSLIDTFLTNKLKIRRTNYDLFIKGDCCSFLKDDSCTYRIDLFKNRIYFVKDDVAIPFDTVYYNDTVFVFGDLKQQIFFHYSKIRNVSKLEER